MPRVVTAKPMVYNEGMVNTMLRKTSTGLERQKIAVANINLLLAVSRKKKKDLADIIMDARGYLFPGRFVGHVEESYIGDHISHLLPDGYAAHTLRHRFATTAYAATHDLFVVAELLGHESVETTEHYVAMPDGRLREATAAVRLI